MRQRVLDPACGSRVNEPPIAEATGWIKGRTFPPDKPLIDVSQAIPGYPPPAELTQWRAGRLADPATARYTEIEGLPDLRQALAENIERRYGGEIVADDVMISTGCNQAFCLSMPNNPTGAIYPPEVIEAFAQLARDKGIALILDETYRDFMDGSESPHALFRHAAWRDTLVHLYSFSKVFCLTGYRVGAVVCGPRLGREIAKAMDTVAICAPRIGQLAALQGLRSLDGWRQAKQALMDSRLHGLRAAMATTEDGYRIVSAGAYFAYLRHPFTGQSSGMVARRLADEQNLLCLPGAMFGEGQEAYLRFAFANVAAERMSDIAERLDSDARA